MKNPFPLIAILFIIFLLAGCGHSTTTTPLSSLADTSWQLKSYGQPAQLTPVPGDSVITLNFRGTGGYDGSSGSPDYYYGGQCRISGNQLNIIALTETSNHGATGLKYLDLLRQAQTFEASATGLIIHSQNGQDLVFSRLN